MKESKQSLRTYGTALKGLMGVPEEKQKEKEVECLFEEIIMT